ncbi:MAG TPA: prepilin-type N-terminal cleavage/methylation domain-containing protein [Chthonomonadales bacterium]|nr:prepilin-type N-terminal cleavage/methylation domain-containing protein [Chthonomonadales bacterium]
MSRPGLTLLELLIALTLMTVLAMALNYAFISGLNMQRAYNQRQASQDQTQALEQHITRWLQGAKLTSDTTDTTSYFLGTEQYGTQTDLGIDRLTFTTTAPGVPMSAQQSTDDFETQQQNNGPVGGVTEISWSTAPVGEAQGKTGLFERYQHPSDGDPSQGGLEHLLSSQVGRIGFEFYNGSAWVNTWDTVNGQRRLPAAVMVNYTIAGDSSGAVHTLLVSIPASDVDATNPSTNGQ